MLNALAGRRSGSSLAAGACAIGVALAVKAFYSRAGATDLLWILAPSAWLARFAGGIDLVFEQGAGFISHTHRMVVGPSCAGVNFLVISFLCLYFSFVRYRPSRLGWLAWSLLVAYAATIAANGLRIFVSAHLWNADIYSPGLTQEAVHRIAGIVIYYGSLLALYVAVESRIGHPAPTSAPLLWYAGVSLGVPLLGRATAVGSPVFAAHAAWVLGIAAFLTLVKVLPSALRNRIH